MEGKVIYDCGVEKLEFTAPKICRSIVYYLHRGIFFNKLTQSFIPLILNHFHYFQTLGTWYPLPAQLSWKPRPKPVLLAGNTCTLVIAMLQGTCNFPFPCSSGAFSDCYSVTSEHFSRCVSIRLKKRMLFWAFREVQGHYYYWRLPHIKRLKTKTKHYGRITKILTANSFYTYR